MTAWGPKRGRPASDQRRVLDGVIWIARTGAPWCDLPDDFGKWSSVYRQFRRWPLSGLWDAMLEALNATGAAQSSVQKIDSTIVRARQHAADPGPKVLIGDCQESCARGRFQFTGP